MYESEITRFLIVDDDGFLHLTAIGQEVAEKSMSGTDFYGAAFVSLASTS